MHHITIVCSFIVNSGYSLVKPWTKSVSGMVLLWYNKKKKKHCYLRIKHMKQNKITTLVSKLRCWFDKAVSMSELASIF